MEVIVIVTTKFCVIVTIINIICAYQKKKKKNIICVRVWISCITYFQHYHYRVPMIITWRALLSRVGAIIIRILSD